MKLLAFVGVIIVVAILVVVLTATAAAYGIVGWLYWQPELDVLLELE